MLESTEAFVIFMLPPGCEWRAPLLLSSLGSSSAGRGSVDAAAFSGRPTPDATGQRVLAASDGRYLTAGGPRESGPHLFGVGSPVLFLSYPGKRQHHASD